jgi:hypothetical protein
MIESKEELLIDDCRDVSHVYHDVKNNRVLLICPCEGVTNEFDAQIQAQRHSRPTKYKIDTARSFKTTSRVSAVRLSQPSDSFNSEANG